MNTIDKITDTMTPSPVTLAVSNLIDEFLAEQMMKGAQRKTTSFREMAHLNRRRYKRGIKPLKRFQQVATDARTMERDMEMIIQTAILKAVRTPHNLEASRNEAIKPPLIPILTH